MKLILTRRKREIAIDGGSMIVTMAKSIKEKVEMESAR